MALTIHDVKEKVVDFCVQELGRDPAAVHFLKITHGEKGWCSGVELTEQNELLKKLGYPPVFDRIIYKVDLDEEGNVISFCKKGEEDEEL